MKSKYSIKWFRRMVIMMVILLAGMLYISIRMLAMNGTFAQIFAGNLF